MTDVLRYCIEADRMVPVTQEWVNEVQQMIGLFAGQRCEVHQLSDKMPLKATRKQLRDRLGQIHKETAPEVLVKLRKKMRTKS